MDWSKVAEYWWVLVVVITTTYFLYFLFLKKESQPQEAYGHVDWASIETFLRDSELEEVIPCGWSGQGSHDTGTWLYYDGASVMYKQIYADTDEAEVIGVTVKDAPTCEVTYKNGGAILLMCAGLTQREFSEKQRNTLRRFRDRVRLRASFSADETSRLGKGKIWPLWSS